MDKWVIKCKSEGLCRRCGKPADPKQDGGKYRLCAACRELDRSRRDSLAAVGLCKGCGEPLNGDKHKYCEKCRAYARQFYWRRVYGV